MHKGVTIIEILVAIAVVAIMAGVGMGISINASKRKTVENTAILVRTQLFQARSHALQGKKVQCASTDKLAGWQVSFTATSMALNENCLSSGLHVTKTTTFPPGVTATPLPSPSSVDFAPVTGVPNLSTTVTVTITGSASPDILVTISPQGLIQ